MVVQNITYSDIYKTIQELNQNYLLTDEESVLYEAIKPHLPEDQREFTLLSLTMTALADRIFKRLGVQDGSSEKVRVHRLEWKCKPGAIPFDRSQSTSSYPTLNERTPIQEVPLCRMTVDVQTLIQQLYFRQVDRLLQSMLDQKISVEAGVEAMQRLDQQKGSDLFTTLSIEKRIFLNLSTVAHLIEGIWRVVIEVVYWVFKFIAGFLESNSYKKELQRSEAVLYHQAVSVYLTIASCFDLEWVVSQLDCEKKFSFMMQSSEELGFGTPYEEKLHCTLLMSSYYPWQDVDEAGVEKGGSPRSSESSVLDGDWTVL